MIRTFLFPLFPFVFFGCASGSDSAQDTFLRMEVGTKDTRGTDPLLPVRYLGEEDAVMVQVSRTLPNGQAQVVGWGEVVDGSAVVALAPVPMNPNDGEEDAVFRVAARQMLEGGRPGPYLDVAADAVSFTPPADGAPGGWQVRIPQPDDKALVVPLRRGVEVADRLLPVIAAAIGGNVSDDLQAQRFAMALLTDAEATVPAFITPSMTTSGNTFAVATRGPPPADTLLGPDGPTSGRYWPVAWADADGEAGFNPEGDELLGVACTTGGVTTFVWQANPRTLSEAASLADAGLRAGWSLHTEGPNGLQPLSGAFTPWLSGDCL